MILGTHILAIGSSKVLQLPLHLFTNTLYGYNNHQLLHLSQVF